ncbi:tyrosine-type recombinase/integrase [Sporosarcina newyorkensis]|uniref:Site-specific recombinase XerD n=1 Tax=Sporosarcina newyorkensis TaxID=759851 RepID=A0A1T4YHJ9_9BACL|nr:site-specific integrase [Sporosarcina newyorkensis]SKB01312.1 Site-specific recombinase XerD [Sporosarcina newyorkensis]
MSRSRKHGVFAVSGDVVVLPSKNNEKKRESLTISSALETVFQQMRISGNRQRTIESYQYIFEQFVTVNNLQYVEDITVESIYHYLDILEVKPSTKLIRLKSTKAVLSKFFNNGWIKEKFWNNIHIKIDKEVKKGANESDIDKLLELIDQSSFIGFRDAAAIKLMYKTGIRIRTLGELRERHIDFENMCLSLAGSTLKNHKFLKLPIDDELAIILKMLIKFNEGISRHFETDNRNVFITQNGLAMNTSKSSNCAISKQLNKYAKRFGLENINAHAIRRAYAKNLLNKGASIALISKALGHSDLAVTTQYLDIDIEEVATNLRDFL